MAERLYDIKEIAKRTRETLAKEFPTLTFSVSIERYSGGQSMSVSLMKGDFNPFAEKPENGHIQLNNNYIDRDERLTEEGKKVMTRAREVAQTYNWDKSDPMTDYFDVNYYLHMGIGKWDKPYQEVEGKKSTSKTTTTSGAPKKSYPMGEVLKDCSGWTIYKKTLPDGRIVYNAKIKPETPKNKGDWNTIKGEIYTDTGFKWGKFGAFEKWGQIASEAFIVEKLCEILGKYYEGGEKPTPSEEPTPTPMPETPTPTPESEERLFKVNDVVETPMGRQIIIKGVSEDNNIYGAYTKNSLEKFELPVSVSDMNDLLKKGEYKIIGRWDGEKVVTSETPKKSKEDIEKAIKGLQFLADKGNEKAKKAIIGLKILLNK
jgi:hypothetical protein